MEIAFLAISSLEQVKGFGTRLMNKLKDHCKKDGIEYFLTYADNNAIGYFKKQGFNKALRLAPDKWRGLIKDYDGGTLMECHVENYICYSKLSEILKEQKKDLQKLADSFLNVKRKHTFSELDKSFKENDIKPEDIKENEPVPKNVFEAIPGLKAAGWTYEDYIKQLKIQEKGEKNFMFQCREIITKAKTHKSAWPFLEPVDKEKVPDYYDMIKEPMDLQTLEKNLESGNYKCKEHFVKALNLIFSNCKTFNPKNSVFFKAAVNLETDLEADIKNLEDE
ncbi:MAG: GNAT family N-acetyltransferase [archaeon]|nr:GNAT family N-acetyltransferase [archaeon]